MYQDWIPGAVLRVWSARYGVWHFGIASSIPGYVYHASKDRGQFALTSFTEFSEGQTVTYEWYPESHQVQMVLNRANGVIGHRYDLFSSNCEDFVNWVITGTARSPQREQTVAALVLLLIVLGVGSALAG